MPRTLPILLIACLAGALVPAVPAQQAAEPPPAGAPPAAEAGEAAVGGEDGEGTVAEEPLPGPGRETEVRLAHGGLDRVYRLYVPGRYDGRRRTPLVVVLHGAWGSAKKMARKSGFNELADAHGFLVAYPQGTSLARTWNAGFCCGRSLKREVDDVGFLAAVLADLEEDLAVDPDRIYLVGESNGAMLAYRYAAERTEDLAGIGIVAGSLGGQLPGGEGEWRIPQPQAPIALVAIHGTADRKVPHDGSGGDMVSATESVHYIANQNLCAPLPQETEMLFGGKVRREWWGGCSLSSNVLFLSLQGHGHDWPSAEKTLSLGRQDGRGFDAATAIWKFLRAERRWRKMDLTPVKVGSR